MRRKKVLVNAIPLTYVQTGISRYLRSLYLELERDCPSTYQFFYYDGQVVSSRMPSPPKELRRWIRLTDWFWRLPSPLALGVRVLLFCWHERKFQKLSRGFDLYHEAGFFPFRSSLPTLFTVHDLSLLRFPHTHPKERVLFFKLFFPSRLSVASKILAVSNFTKHELMHWMGLRPDQIIVTPLGYDQDLFYHRPYDQVQRFLCSKSLPQKFFLFVGGGDPRKNISLYPKAVSISRLSMALVVVGWSGWRKQRKSLENGQVIFLNYVTDHDLALLYNGALALVYPSKYEGFGLPVLEAMASGCPVIVSNEASLPEVAGPAGIYVDLQRGEESLAAALQCVAMSMEERKQYISLGLERAKEFSWSKTAEMTAQILADL